MANIKSAKKRVLVSRLRADKNKAIRSRVKTFVKKTEAAIEAGNKDEAKTVLTATISEIDKARVKGVYHPNTASRKIARLSHAVDAMQ